MNTKIRKYLSENKGSKKKLMDTCNDTIDGITEIVKLLRSLDGDDVINKRDRNDLMKNMKNTSDKLMTLVLAIVENTPYEQVK